MNYLQKMDLVLNCLFNHSGENPTFEMIEGWLDHNLIHKGEIQDILLYFHREQMMYCEFEGIRTYPYSDGQGVHYLISCKGKLFLEGVGGFEKEKVTSDAESIRVEKLEISQQKLMRKLNLVTAWIAGGTIALVLVELLSITLEHHWF